MKLKRPAKLTIGLTAVVAVLCLAFWGTQNQGGSRSLTPIASIAGWQRGYGDVLPGEPYLWLTDHELFHFENTLQGLQAFTYDTRSHMDSPEPGLNTISTGHVLSASPDGQWVFWYALKGSAAHLGMVTTRRTDGKTVLCPLMTTSGKINSTEGFWEQDSHRWIGTGLHDVDHPSLASYPLPWCDNVLGVDGRGHVISGDTFLGTEGLPGYPVPPLWLTETRLDAPRSKPRSFYVSQPRPGPNCGVLLSPQGDRLLWINVTIESSAMAGWLSSWTGHPFNGVTMSLDIWVCPLDGSPRRHVGTWRGQKTSYQSSVRWNPDGRHISFTIEDTLYSVPVDQI